jgi:hypothetical protein
MTRLMTLSWRFLLILTLERARSIKLRGEIYGYEYHEYEEEYDSTGEGLSLASFAVRCLEADV